MLTVVCVMKSGGDFDTTFVEKLERSCFLNLETHRFICLTDIVAERFEESTFISYVPLTEGFRGWWSKIEVFKPPVEGHWCHVGDPILYFDLDTVIIRDISHLFGAIDCDLVLLRDFYRPQTHRATGIMGWTAGWFDEIYETFKADPDTFMTLYRSDQEFIHWLVPTGLVRYWQDEFPGHVVSYKVHCAKGLPGDAHVVCFHGKPRPNSEQVRIESPWMTDKWRIDE